MAKAYTFQHCEKNHCSFVENFDFILMDLKIVSDEGDRWFASSKSFETSGIVCKKLRGKHARKTKPTD